MRFQCPFCSYVMSADDSHRGYKIDCMSCGKSVLVPVGRFEDGCVIGDFVIRGKIGEGSIGAVYRAVQISLDRTVALKILSADYTNNKGVNDFLREARAAAKLIHTNIVQALAVGEEDGTCYMAMSYIDGETVKDRLKREGKIPVDESLHIVQQVAEALYYAWDEAGLIHRDVKPDNIMIAEDGIVKLTDLGLAIQQTEWRADMEISGSPSYMSPEQFAGEKLDSRSDIYSLGVTLYQMVSGVLPFDGATVKTVARQHFETEAVPLHKRDQNVPVKVSDFVRKMMAKRADERFKDMEELLHAIWKLRQKTAPDTSLIPDVHTISIKRLDYDMQHDILEKRVAEAEASGSFSIGKLLAKIDPLKAALFTMPVVLGLAILLALVVGYGSADEDKMRRSVEYYARLTADKTMDLAALQKEGSSILAEFGPVKTAKQELLRTQLRLQLSDVERRIAEANLEKLRAAQSEMQTQLSSIRANLAASGQRADQLARRSSAAEDDRSLLKAELARTRDELVKAKDEAVQLKSSNKSLADYAKKLHLESERFWMDELLGDLFVSVSQGRLKDASAMLSIESLRRGVVYKDFFAEWSSRVSKLERLQADFSDSGALFAGLPVEPDGKLSMIDSGVVEYQDSLGKTRQKSWAELSAANAYALASAKNRLLGRSEVEFKSSFELLKGNLGYAVKAAPDDRELAAMAHAVMARELAAVKVAALAQTEKSRAEAMAMALLKRFEGSDESQAQIRRELKGIAQQ